MNKFDIFRVVVLASIPIIIIVLFAYKQNELARALLVAWAVFISFVVGLLLVKD